jgi:hopanoid biosynthesis associated protein HpnK
VKALIVTADDFGLSLPVNDAVERAHRTGILSAASLMVGAPAVEDAVARARALPALGVGLHLTLLDGHSVLPQDEVPGLVGPDGRFPSDPLRFGIALYFSPELRRQAHAEINAQFDRFRATGLRMDHINGHQHFHMHPVVLSAIARNACRFDSPPVRVPLEPFGPSFRAARDRAFGRFANWLFYFAQTRRMRRTLTAAGIPSNDHLFGLNDSGAMVEGRILRLVDCLPEGISELYCHPATRRWKGPDNLPYRYRAEEELGALLSPTVRNKIESYGIRPLSYRAAIDAARGRAAQCARNDAVASGE